MTQGVKVERRRWTEAEDARLITVGMNETRALGDIAVLARELDRTPEAVAKRLERHRKALRGAVRVSGAPAPMKPAAHMVACPHCGGHVYLQEIDPHPARRPAGVRGYGLRLRDGRMVTLRVLGSLMEALAAAKHAILGGDDAE